MAQSNNSLILLVGGAAVAWYGYTQGWFSSLLGSPVVTPVPVPVPTTGGTTTTTAACNPPNALINGVCTAPAGPSQGTNPPTAALNIQLVALAGGTYSPTGVQTLQTPDQWSYYYQQIPGKTVSAQQMSNILASLATQGILDRSEPIPVDVFISALSANGLSGFGNVGYRRIPVPVLVRPAYGKYTTADLRRAGGR